MRIGTRTKAAVVAGLAATAMVATTTPAYSAAAWRTCPIGTFCIYTGYNGTGYMASFSSGSDDLDRTPIGGVNFNDKTLSVWNRTNGWWCLWEHERNVSDGGAHLEVHLGQQNMGSDWANRVSSLRPWSIFC